MNAVLDRAALEATVKSLLAAQAKMAQMVHMGMGRPGRPTTEFDPGEDTIEPKPMVTDKAMRAHIALADARHAVQEAFAALGVRPT